jgi:hypothetical protein
MVPQHLVVKKATFGSSMFITCLQTIFFEDKKRGEFISLSPFLSPIKMDLVS